jgi:hypothetical protein
MRTSLLLCTLLVSACVGRSDDFGGDRSTLRGGKFDCTHTIGYWKTHSSLATKPSLQHAWPISESTLLCGETWYDLLWTQPEGDPWVILAHQWIGAHLNWGSGVEMPPDIEPLMSEANWYLSECGADESLEARMIELAELLDAYNNGLAGVAHCE